jgi:hypothetical protein
MRTGRRAIVAALATAAAIASAAPAAGAATWRTTLTGPFHGTADTIKGPHAFDVNARGTAVVAWLEGDGTSVLVSVRDRARGSFGEPIDLGPHGPFTQGPVAAVDHAGGTTVVWIAGEEDHYRAMKAYRPPRGHFDPPVQLSAPDRPTTDGPPAVGVTRRGVVVAAWARAPTNVSHGSDVWVRDPDGGERRDSVPGSATLVRGGEQIAWDVGAPCRSHARAATLHAGADPYGRPHRFPFAFDESVTSPRGQTLAAEYDYYCRETAFGTASILRAFVLSPGGHAVGGEVYGHGFETVGALGVADSGAALLSWVDVEGRPRLTLRRPHGRFSRARPLTGRCSTIAGPYDVAMDRRGNAVLLAQSSRRGGRIVTAVKPRGSTAFRVPVRVSGRLTSSGNPVVTPPQIEYDGRGNATATWHAGGRGMVTATIGARSLRALARRSRHGRCPGVEAR